ncbi:aldose epimerase family protein [Pseudooceanicola sp.]|uniref:aldose epimerase family protein n=1 Tax=Pseudooceanicola sp. TaxID=1914328 RepID=UPI0035C73E33
MSAVDTFGTLPDGRDVARIHLRAGKMEAAILTWGATVQDLRFDGQRVVVGSDDLADYLGPLLYAGATVGRFANRIGNARFTLDGADHHTDPNFLDRHTLHGGSQGTGERLWTLDEATVDSVGLTLVLPDGDMGFPGEMTARCTYRLDPAGALSVEIEAQTTKASPCSFAHHGYFILDDSGDITRHRLTVAADHYLPVDADLIPTGEIADVAGTKFDFRTGREIGTQGYDHNLCLGSDRTALRNVAELTSEASGIAMGVATTEPGLQVYNGAHLGGAPGHGGAILNPRAGLALETQAWPDSPNRATFPPSILRPGETYRAETRYSFRRL